MNTTCISYATPSLRVPLIRHVVDIGAATTGAWWARWMAVRQARRAISELDTLDGLNVHTLKDLGAPEWMVERTHRTQERARQGGLFERDTLHWR